MHSRSAPRHPDINTDSCPSCATRLHGSYCHQCGERRPDSHHDLSLGHFFEESVESVSHLDSRLWRTLWHLAFTPGLLSADFVRGRRVAYIKPLSLFFGMALCFYLLFPTVSAFYANPGDLARGYRSGNLVSNTLRIDPYALISHGGAESEDELAARALTIAREHAAHASKSWLFALVPFWALALWAMLGWRQPSLVPHLVFALHGMTMFMLLDLVGLGAAFYIFRYESLGDVYTAVLIGSMTLWCVLAVRRAYGLSRVTSVPVGVVVAGAFVVFLVLYRQVVTLASLWSDHA